MKLPTFGEARKAVQNKTSTPLDRFIHHWEPQGKEEESFRTMLSSLLDWVRIGGVAVNLTKDEIEEAIANLPRYQSKDPYEGFQEADNPLRFFWNPETERYEEKRWN